MDGCDDYWVLHECEVSFGGMGLDRNRLTGQSARLAKRVIPHIRGRVLVQTLPTNAYDKDKIVAHATAYAKAFNDEGIPK
jgi:hypothetical protein